MIYFLLLGSYILTSYILLKHPNILHKKKNLMFRAKHISHRGGAAERIENTMEAFRNAKAVGTDMLELDCQLTKDGHVVVSHDDNLSRICNSQLCISETEYQHLPLLKEKVKVDFYQKMFGEGKDHRIPLLEDVFREFPDLAINIDIKVNNDILMKKNPKVPLIFSLRQVTLLLIFYWTGLLPFINLKESLLEIIVPGIMLDSQELIDMPLSRKAKFVFWIMDKLLIRPSLIKHLDDRGIQTYLWVLNREKDFDRAFKAGATGVMSDRIVLLRKYLDSKISTTQANFHEIKQD
ncbi:lysophospholipase D GDPD1-like isoform X2 [Biomphalaria glabrata]|uniref:Lysophospholipase D GDPD1-like isoform X2 n=1 Tax=Biomphalaria glabrata TaxID=6526 RepID=A0A9W2YI20_BIOGL|nr:lysophospholipase D GDPD1-like isoform X2 [Biomphalaria glabrata]